jgi:hypothetical protein
MTYLKPPAPDEPNPPGVTPNQPDDPDVYGSQWGDVGGQKPKKAPSDRPNPISTPKEDQGAPAANTEKPT